MSRQMLDFAVAADSLSDAIDDLLELARFAAGEDASVHLHAALVNIHCVRTSLQWASTRAKKAGKAGTA